MTRASSRRLWRVLRAAEDRYALLYDQENAITLLHEVAHGSTRQRVGNVIREVVAERTGRSDTPKGPRSTESPRGTSEGVRCCCH
jgi:hypothetical protein